MVDQLNATGYRMTRAKDGISLYRRDSKMWRWGLKCLLGRGWIREAFMPGRWNGWISGPESGESTFYTIEGVDVYQKEFCALIRMLTVLLWHGRKATWFWSLMQLPLEDFFATTLFRIRKKQKQNCKAVSCFLILFSFNQNLQKHPFFCLVHHSYCILLLLHGSRKPPTLLSSRWRWPRTCITDLTIV